MLEITIDRNSDQPLYAQIRDALRSIMEDGTLKAGRQLPTVNALAAQIGVTQSTIRRALEDLTKSGHIISQVGRGTFVRVPGEKEPDEPAAKAAGPKSQADPEFRAAARRVRNGITKSLETLLTLNQRSGLIDFTTGIPGADSVRPGILEEITAEALRKGHEQYQFCGNEPLGIMPLREVIAERYCRAGLEVHPDQVLITNGAQQGISLMALKTREQDRRFICETPCFTGVPNAFGALGNWIEHVPRDEEGPDMERLRHFSDGRQTTLYLCPAIHNPMGTDLSENRRVELVDWVQSQKVVVIADEIFNDLRVEHPGPKSLFSYLGPKKCVVVSSLSKSFMTSLRIGWLITKRNLVSQLGGLKRSLDLGCSPLMQGIVLALFTTGAYDEHLSQVTDFYRLRRDAALDALDRFMPREVTWTRPGGGFHIWFSLPQGYSSIVLYMMAIDHGVSFVPGPYMDIDHRFVNCGRLSYAQVDPDQIREGVELLAFAVRQLLESPPGDLGLSGLGDFL